MTPAERAEKIMNYQAANELSWDKMIDFIAVQIGEAEREAIEKERDSSVHSRKMELVGVFKATRDKAAEIAKDHARIKGAHIHKGFAYCVEQVAAEIRAMEAPK
jgi:hypothetical protein